MKHVIDVSNSKVQYIEIDVGSESTLITMVSDQDSTSVEFNSNQTSQIARFIEFANGEAKKTKND